MLAVRANGADESEAPAWEGPDMITEVATEQAVWDCTNCGWCEEGCPVGIEHIQRIDDMRRHLVLMESRFPQEATSAFKGIEVQGNPWGIAQEKRAEWAEGLDIPQMADLEDPTDIDVMYWVGCAGSYDERNQRVSRAFSGVMKKAGVRFAMLGKEEVCTGDPARRLGNEYLYATMAAQNLETINRYKPKRIVTQCPHCYHNLKKEYPDFGEVGYEVVHEAEFIDELIKAGRLQAEQGDQSARHLPRPVLHGAARSQMEQRAAGAGRDSRRRSHRRRPVEKSHLLLRRGRRMHVEGRSRPPSHQRGALRSTDQGQARNGRHRMPVLHDHDDRRDEGAIAGRDHGSARPVRTGRRSHGRVDQVRGATSTLQPLVHFGAEGPNCPIAG